MRKYLTPLFYLLCGFAGFYCGFTSGKNKNPAVYRLAPELEAKMWEDSRSIRAWIDDLNGAKVGHIRIIGNAVWKKERFLE